jgi:hypothetical protein
MDPGSMHDLARKAVLGLTIDFATAWQLIPWTWLTDWCYDVSSYLKANRNIIPAELDEVSIIRHIISHYDADPVTINTGSQIITFSGGTNFAESKYRNRVSAFPVAHFPFLSGN